MTLYTPTLVAPISENYGATTAGVVAVPITPNIGGDGIQLFGDSVTLRFATTGTVAVITFDSVDLSSFGQDQNLTLTMGATQVQYVKFDGSVSRFKQQSGNIGYLMISYSSVTGLLLEAQYDS
jgi:hypothetical protein